MRCLPILGNSQKLDGGAMFGNAPKELWKRWTRPDELNRIPLATRALFLELDDGRRYLLETGVGAFFEPKLRERYGIQEAEHCLLQNLKLEGIEPETINGIILSHLHFDHAGGLLTAYEDGKPQLLFPNATIYIGKTHWEHAQKPPQRERASFLPFLHELLLNSGRKVFIEGSSHPDLDFATFDYSDGHTVGLLMTTLRCTERPITFISDLCPGSHWVHIPITMGYDRFPERILEEKKALLDRVIAEKGLLFFTHDPDIAFAEVQRNERGRYQSHPCENTII